MLKSTSAVTARLTRVLTAKPCEKVVRKQCLSSLPKAISGASFQKISKNAWTPLIGSVSSPLALHSSRRWKSAEPDFEDDHDHYDHKGPSEAQLRYDLAVAHRLVARHGMDMLTWNHISHRFGDGCLITPGDKLFEQVRPEDLLISSTNVTADIIHASVYQARPDVNAILHVHTPFATTVSCMEEGFVPYTQDAAYFYNKTVRYEWDGVSNKLEEGPLLQAAVTSIPDCNTLLMDHHGFACFGKSVKEVFVLAYYFERACEVQCRLMASGAKPKIPNIEVMRKAAETSYLPDFAPGESEWDALCRSVSFDD